MEQMLNPPPNAIVMQRICMMQNISASGQQRQNKCITLCYLCGYYRKPLKVFPPF